ncbi:hypothetical protein ACHAWF_015226 [Thalassiosira exigua]
MEMWGDAEGAYSLKQSDSLSRTLFAVTGPDHIPYNDSRWQKLLLHYEKLVHLHKFELTPSAPVEEEDVVGSACQRCAKYSASTSNLAALCLHVARMIRDLKSSLEAYLAASDGNALADKSPLDTEQREANGSVAAGKSRAKQRISLIGKARVTCGATNLLRILSHEIIVQASRPKSDIDLEAEDEMRRRTLYPENNTHDNILQESFTYRRRSQAEVDGQDIGQDAAMDIVASSTTFISSIGRNIHQGADGILAIPEIYDAQMQILSLLLVFLSTQLYHPMASSSELEMEGRPNHCQFFLGKWMEYALQQKNKEERLRQQQAQSLGQENTDCLGNETRLFLYSCLRWLIDRPKPPRRSISSHYAQLPKSIAKQMTNMATAPDGMYESHTIVMACFAADGNKKAMGGPTQQRVPSHLPGKSTSAPGEAAKSTATIALGTDDSVDLSSPGHVSDATSWNTTSSLLSHPIRSIFLLSSTFFLLPIRLVRLAFNLLGHSRYRAIMGDGNSYMKNMTDGDRVILQQIEAHCDKNSGWNKTNNILWLTDSPIADMGSALMLILSNNCRASNQNPFRSELISLGDDRWTEAARGNFTTGNSLFPSSSSNDDQMATLSINFESLFESFSRVVHTEVGALSLYTLLLSSPKFAESCASRTDLDKLVMPLLRTLYYSTAMPSDPKSTQTPANRPFRSQSQLYVILILLLIFSQDHSFGRDSFQRVHVPQVKWYKERCIKDKEASLGSMILLVLLRAITFNLNLLQDGFLLSNCCAVLLNMSPHILGLQDYVAARLVSVTASCFKRYADLVVESGGEPEEGDLSSSIGLHGETCRTLLTLVKHSIRRKSLEKNIHLVYALLLEQREFQNVCHFSSLGDMSPIPALIQRANTIIQEKGNGMTADQTLGMLKMQVKELRTYSASEVSDIDSVSSDASDLGNLTFTYEEESDP